MIRSMTGFGRFETPLETAGVAVEVRSVNSRHLDVRVRLPRGLQSLEPGLRELASRAFSRGQVDVSVRPLAAAAPDIEVEIDLEVARRYAEAARTLQTDQELAGGLTASALLSLPGVSRSREMEIDAGLIDQVLRRAVEGACNAVLEMRAREGRALERELRERLSTAEALVTQIERRAEEARGGLRERLEKRIAALAPELEVDPGRLEQEIVLYADRMDVTEETVRSRSHLAQFRETLEVDGPVGRKLEFILQEMSRETNTIGAKAADAALTRCVVELKTELEKLREQVLNVE